MKSMESFIRANVRAMAGYTPGEQPRDDAFIKLNTNENPYPPSPRGFEAVRSTVMDGALHSTLACGRRWIAQGLPGSVVSMLVTWVWTGSPYVLPSTMAKTAISTWRAGIASYNSLSLPKSLTLAASRLRCSF